MVFFCFAAALLGAAVLLANAFVNDRVPKNKCFQTPQCVLAVFAHPDDEIMAAGSLARWKRQGAQVHLLYLTHGEDGPTGGLVQRADLAAAREGELQTVARILQADSLTVLHYPDRYLNTIAPEVIEEEILRRVRQTRPDTVLCFDNTIGLYGHTDHAFAGLCAQRAVQRCPEGVRALLVMTLGHKMIALAKRVSKTFRERYRDENGLPAANLAISIPRTSAQKKRVVLAHQTQHEVVNDVQPFVTKLPHWLYYRIFSKEYYALIPIEQRKKEGYYADNSTKN